MTLKNSIKTEAGRLGFELFGVTTPDPPPHYANYEDWLHDGRHGEMSYLATERARQRRADPRQIMPECQSILVAGMRYPTPAQIFLYQDAPGGQQNGRVAAYAWGDDYHTVLVERLQQLVAFVEFRLGNSFSYRIYTDTGPLLERELAQRAGLGWIGKNTCLINPKAGSYFLLGEVLLDIDLEPDAPFEADRCGSCSRCLEACPTGCILPDRTIDARRCISYLTIELKGSIPTDLRPAIGNWVFGCDVCQEVCPWNQRFAGMQGDSAFDPHPDIPAPILVNELSLTPQAFNRKFVGSPVKRAKRGGYLRNVAVALGNTLDPSCVPALANVLKHEGKPLVRKHAAWALGQIGGSAAYQSLQAAYRSETDPGVREAILSALEHWQPFI
jgi:epoxyqueuosine reductase